MRILIVTPDYPPPYGGIQTLTKNLERGMRALGHKTQILHVENGDQRLPRDIVPALRVRRPKQVLRYPHLNHVYKRSRKAIRDFTPDLVHVMHVANWPALNAADRAGVPSVTSTHALELASHSSVAAAAATTDAFHAVSRFTANLTRSVVDTDDASVYVVPPSIDVSAARSDMRAEGPVVSVARLVKRKNIETLINAWTRLPVRLREEHGLSIAGDGQRKNELQTLAAGDDTIEILGRVSEARKDELLRRASVFALVPVCDGFDVEGFGIVFTEAQAWGTPVLGASNGGIPDAIGDAGYLVDDPRDQVAVAEGLERLLTDEDFRERCHEAIERRIHRFGLERVAADHVEQYEHLLRDCRPLGT